MKRLTNNYKRTKNIKIIKLEKLALQRTEEREEEDR